MAPTRSPRDVLDEILPAGAPVVVDVGCGDGSLVRHLARRGAPVVGVGGGAGPRAPPGRWGGWGERARAPPPPPGGGWPTSAGSRRVRRRCRSTTSPPTRSC